MYPSQKFILKNLETKKEVKTFFHSKKKKDVELYSQVIDLGEFSFTTSESIADALNEVIFNDEFFNYNFVLIYNKTPGTLNLFIHALLLFTDPNKYSISFV